MCISQDRIGYAVTNSPKTQWLDTQKMCILDATSPRKSITSGTLELRLIGNLTSTSRSPSIERQEWNTVTSSLALTAS